MRHASTFTLTALLTLAVGIGASTAIFTLTQAIMLKSLQVANPAQLYGVISYSVAQHAPISLIDPAQTGFEFSVLISSTP